MKEYSNRLLPIQREAELSKEWTFLSEAYMKGINSQYIKPKGISFGNEHDFILLFYSKLIHDKQIGHYFSTGEFKHPTSQKSPAGQNSGRPSQQQ